MIAEEKKGKKEEKNSGWYTWATMFLRKNLSQFLHSPQETIRLSRLCFLNQGSTVEGAVGKLHHPWASLWEGNGRLAIFPRRSGAAPNPLLKTKVK